MSLNPEKYLKLKFEKLNSKINKHEMLQSQESNNSMDLEELMIQQRKGLGSIKSSLDDIENGVSRRNYNIVAINKSFFAD